MNSTIRRNSWRPAANSLCCINKCLILSFYSFSFIVLSNRSNRRTDQLREWARILWWKMGLGCTQAADSLIQPSSAKVSPLDCCLIWSQKSELAKKEVQRIVQGETMEHLVCLTTTLAFIGLWGFPWLGWQIAVALIFFTATQPPLFLPLFIGQGPVDCSMCPFDMLLKWKTLSQAHPKMLTTCIAELETKWTGRWEFWCTKLAPSAVDGFMKFYESEKRSAAVGAAQPSMTSAVAVKVFLRCLNISTMGKVPSMNLWEFWRKDGLERLGRHDSLGILWPSV